MRLAIATLALAAPMLLAACTTPVVTIDDPVVAPVSEPPLLLSSVTNCSGTEAESGILNDQNVLRANGRNDLLTETPVASGSKYIWDGQSETSFWSKGEGGLLVLGGTPYADCVRTGRYTADPASETLQPGRWKARGSEAGWTLTLEGKQMIFVHNYGAITFRTSQPLLAKVEGGVVCSSASNALMVTVLEKTLADDMAGMPDPQTVPVVDGGQTFNGCRGEPDSVLAGGEWSVSKINGVDVIAAAPITLNFDPASKHVRGSSGCNTYGGAYTLSGEGLSFGNLVGTLMACDPESSDQERRFPDTLKTASAFEIDASGGLVLSGPEGDRIEARK